MIVDYVMEVDQRLNVLMEILFVMRASVIIALKYIVRVMKNQILKGGIVVVVIVKISMMLFV